MKLHFVLPVLCLLWQAYAVPRGDLRIIWYNVENLFHPRNDSIPGDDEFTPEGLRHWTYFRYRNKLTALAKVIVAAGGWEPPDVVGMCEVEDSTVLADLVFHPILEPYGYTVLHRDSPDPRGMDVACIYREKRIGLVKWEVFPSMAATGGGTRDMVHVCCTWGSQDTVDLFLVHLISKYGGAGATAESRKKQVEQMIELGDSVSDRRENHLMVMAGDFNEELEGYSMAPFRVARIGDDSIESVNLGGVTGSYKYRGRWSRIDQFLVCGSVNDYILEGSIMELPVLLSSDEQYGGLKPSRTFNGYYYRGGISDHLPIVLDISRRPFLFHSER